MTIYPGIWAEAFERWVQADRQRDAIIDFDNREFALPADMLLETLWHCDDPMPDDICETLEIPLASTYSTAARNLYYTFSERTTCFGRSSGRSC